MSLTNQDVNDYVLNNLVSPELKQLIEANQRELFLGSAVYEAAQTYGLSSLRLGYSVGYTDWSLRLSASASTPGQGANGTAGISISSKTGLTTVGGFGVDTGTVIIGIDEDSADMIDRFQGKISLGMFGQVAGGGKPKYGGLYRGCCD